MSKNNPVGNQHLISQLQHQQEQQHQDQNMMDYKDHTMTDDEAITTAVNLLQSTQLNDKNSASAIMTSSLASVLDDSTPSDSGVQLLDSISSDLNELSLMSNSGIDFDMGSTTINNNNNELIKSTDTPINNKDITFGHYDAIITSTPMKSQQSSAAPTVIALPDLLLETKGKKPLTSHLDNIDQSILLTKNDVDNTNAMMQCSQKNILAVHDDDDDENNNNINNINNDNNIVNDNNNNNDNAEDDDNVIVDVMQSSTCSTFDTENIVYRRNVKKSRTSSTGSTNSQNSQPKKRVSFHEDILKNTKTDNIHIEHGFVTYKGAYNKYNNSQNGSRYSWSSGNDGKAYCDSNKPSYYRNACSDVLDYGKTDINDNKTSKYVAYDNSGVFEYGPQNVNNNNNNNNSNINNNNTNICNNNNNNNNENENNEFYKCNCSSSNSSLDSSSNDENDNKTTNRNYQQSKSNSCDCFGMQQQLQKQQQQQQNQLNNNVITDNCYFSEPNMEMLDQTSSYQTINRPKSVWSKEKKPKSSCLKASSKHHKLSMTNVIPEYDLRKKVKKFNVHPLPDVYNIIDNSKMIFGSLKNIFGIPLPERGVPEGCEDLQSVYECDPDIESFTTINNNMKNGNKNINENGVILRTKNSNMHNNKNNVAHQSAKQQRAFLSKSFDGGVPKPDNKQPKQYIHNVDEQLRSRTNDQEMMQVQDNDNNNNNNNNNSSATSSPTVLTAQPSLKQSSTHVLTNKVENELIDVDLTNATASDSIITGNKRNNCIKPSNFNTDPNANYRNKYIINCESTVFEHTGVSYETDNAQTCMIPSPIIPAKATIFSTEPLKQKLSSLFKSFRDSSSSTTKNVEKKLIKQNKDERSPSSNNIIFEPPILKADAILTNTQIEATLKMSKSPLKSNDSTSKIMSNDILTVNTAPASSSANINNNEQQCNSPLKNRHLASPLRRKSSQTIRYDNKLLNELCGKKILTSPHQPSYQQLSSQQFASQTSLKTPPYPPYQSSASAMTTSTTSTTATSTCFNQDEFDDILTITTTSGDNPIDDTNDNELIIVDYPDVPTQQELSKTLLRIPSQSSSISTSSKSSLINRFLRNVTQRKILDVTKQQYNIINSSYNSHNNNNSNNNNAVVKVKLNSERKPFNNIYVKGVRPRSVELIEDLNAEIALELEMSGCCVKSKESPKTPDNDNNLNTIIDEDNDDGGLTDIGNLKIEYGLGVGELSADIFNENYKHILRDDKEKLMKVFKLYTGYSIEGYMTPVLVFLTDKTLYVTDLIRNRLCNKFVLPYSELDVILIGPYGNTVLLSNSTRDLQQVLLAGGPYPADGLVSSLEMCARRGGFNLPAVGQLTLDHLAPLQAFVRENSSVLKNDAWVYYAVVSVPANLLHQDDEPLGPHIKGPLMFRNVIQSGPTQQWSAGYFLLKAGVFYMFNDAQQKIPTMAMALSECKGARRTLNAPRPHCFEILMKQNVLQLAAPDEYVASEWLQALVQTASGLFEMQEQHKTLGCTLVMTSNHLITLRENFTAPLRRLNANGNIISPNRNKILNENRKLSTPITTPTDTLIEINSNNSTPSKLSECRVSCSTKSSPIRSINNGPQLIGASQSTTTPTTAVDVDAEIEEKSFSSMSSIYGKNAGIEIKSCAAIQELVSVRVPAHCDNWWCILEFSCREVRENSDDMVIFFATNSDLRRFLTMLETMWQSKNDSETFPITILPDDDSVGKHCSDLFIDVNKSWEPLISAALGYAQ